MLIVTLNDKNLSVEALNKSGKTTFRNNDVTYSKNYFSRPTYSIWYSYDTSDLNYFCEFFLSNQSNNIVKPI